MPAILTDEDIGLDAAPSVSLSDEDIGLTEDHKIVRPPKPGTPPPGYLTPEEVFKAQEKTGLFGGLAEGFTAPMKATARGVGLAALSDETLQEHLLGEYWKATAAPEMTGLGKAGQLIGGLAGTVAQAIPVAAGGARIGGPIGAKAAVMAQFGSMGAYDEFIKAGSQALAEGKTPEEATAIGKKASIAGAGVGAVMGAVAPGAGQGAMDVLKSAAKMGLVGGAGRGIQNVTERALGLSTPVTQDVAKEAAIMALLPAGMGLARFGLGKLFPPPPIEPEVLPAVVPKRPSDPGAPAERAPLALPEPTIPDAEIIPPAQLPPPSGTAWPITPPPPRVPPRLTMPIPMGQGEIPGKPPRTLAEVEALLRTLKEQEPPSEEPPTGEAGVPVGRPPEPPAPISPSARGPQITEAPAEPPLQPAPEVAGGEAIQPEKGVPDAPEKIIEQKSVQPERERTDALRPTAEAGVSDSLRAATEGKAQEKAPEVLLKQEGRNWDLFNENLNDALDAFSPARNTGRVDYDMRDVAERFVDYSKKDTSGKPLDKLVKDFADADEASDSQIRKLRASVKNVLKEEQPTKSPSKPSEGGGGVIPIDPLEMGRSYPYLNTVVQTIKLSADGKKVKIRDLKSGTGATEWVTVNKLNTARFLADAALKESTKQPTTPPTVGVEGKPAKTLMERYEAGEKLTPKEQRELRKSIAATEAETPEVKAETGKRGKTLKEIREAEERRKQEGSFTLQPLEPFVRKAAEHLDKLRAEMGILLRNGKMLEVMTYKKDAANNAAQQYARRIKNSLGKSLFDATGTKYDPFKESRAPTTVRTILMPWEDPHGVQKTALTVGQESFSEAPPNSPEAGVTGLPRLQMQRQKLAAWQPPNEKLGKWKNSLMEGLDYAIANWTRIEPTVRRYDAEMRMQAQAEVNAKVDTLIRSGYVMHAQDVQGLSDFDFLTGRGSGEGASFLKKRYHPTYVDSVMAGVEPRSLDALALAETRIRLGQQKINSRAWTQELRSMTDKTSGNPILTEPNWETRADGKEYPVPPTGDYTIVHMGYQPFAIHKGYETAFKDLTSPSAFTDSLTGRTLLRAAAGTKHIVLAFDTFHLGRLALWSAVYNRGLPAYKKGFVLLDNTVSDLRDMARRGDIPAEYLNDILENKRKIGLAFKTGYNVTRIQDALWQDWMQKIPGIGPFNKFLFGQFQRGAMMQAWLTEFERQRKAFSWLSESDVARKVSKSLNIRFGNLQSQGVFRSKTMQDVARMLFLAPQWNEGLIRSEIGAAKELGEVGSNAVLRRKFAVGTLLSGIGILFAAQFAANQLLNYVTRGHSTFENPEEGLDAKMSAYIPDVVGEGPGLFLSPMALPLETTHLIGKKLEKTDDFDEAFRSYARTRLGTLARPLNTWWTGKDVFGKPIREGELWEGILKEAAPVPISGGSAYHAARQVLSGEKAEQFPGQFQRQAMASFGMKTEGAPTAAQQIGALAQKFNKARGQREIPKQFADYAELDRLLRVGNYKDAQKALDELRTKRKDKDIINRFKVKASSGFTHGSKAVEGQFYNTLTEEQKTAYFNARKEQQDLVSRFYKLWSQSPKQP